MGCIVYNWPVVLGDKNIYSWFGIPKKIQLACISAVAKIINLPYYFWNLKVKLGVTIGQVGSWYLLSQRPRLILVQSLWKCADINPFSFYQCPRYVFLH
jgi:hypothetical protein